MNAPAKTYKPIIKVSHRFGRVSLIIVRKTKKGRDAVTLRLTGEEAKALGEQLVEMSGKVATRLKLRTV